MLDFVIALVILGAVFYLVGLIPMDPVFAKVIRVIAIVMLVLMAINFLLQMTGKGGRPMRLLSHVQAPGWQAPGSSSPERSTAA